MPHYGFIDESGTLQEHEVLTVALVVLDGARVADKLHLKVSKSVLLRRKRGDWPKKKSGLRRKNYILLTWTNVRNSLWGLNLPRLT